LAGDPKHCIVWEYTRGDAALAIIAVVGLNVFAALFVDCPTDARARRSTNLLPVNILQGERLYCYTMMKKKKDWCLVPTTYSERGMFTGLVWF